MDDKIKIEVYEKTYKSIDIVTNDNRCMRISHEHMIYLDEMTGSFEFYYASVKPVIKNGWALVDYSTPRFHEVIGYDLHPVMIPSFTEPAYSLQQYLDFAKLKGDEVVLDLGAYSGLSSIFFSNKCKRVIAVEADPINIACAQTNFSYYNRLTKKNNIELLLGAVWEHNNGIEFSVEGTLGSAAVAHLGKRAQTKVVKSYTLSTITDMYKLKRVDFIKCDVEGAEAVIFKDLDFFKRFKPKMIIEAHEIGGNSVLHECVVQLSALGYRTKVAQQTNFYLPLIECYP